MFPNVGWFEMMVLMGLAVLLFGKRLPEVGRSLGKGIVEFKKGLSGAVDEFDISGTGRSSWRSSSPARMTPAVRPRNRRIPRHRCRNSSYRAFSRRCRVRPSIKRHRGIERSPGAAKSLAERFGPAGKCAAWRACAAWCARRSASVAIKSGGTGLGR